MPVVDDDGTVLGHALAFPDLGEEGERALLAVVQAAIRLMQEEDAADPVGAAERAERQASAVARIRARGRRWRGEAG